MYKPISLPARRSLSQNAFRTSLPTTYLNKVALSAAFRTTLNSGNFIYALCLTGSTAFNYGKTVESQRKQRRSTTSLYIAAEGGDLDRDGKGRVIEAVQISGHSSQAPVDKRALTAHYCVPAPSPRRCAPPDTEGGVTLVY